ncbi:hypothetical protein IWGMT90018_48530 [Mycobacterium kiyosense]|nr:hypothetical protein IWGMT90018_48530 [Mycobacterium kiyosense]
MTDSDGRAVILHGLNQVYKVPPYTPSADGFGDDDAAFLADNGFNAMRIGVIWAAVEPQPLSYDDNYLASIAQTVATLASHGIISLLDFHQDMYNELFGGEGAPWVGGAERRPAQSATWLPRQLFPQSRRGICVECVLAQQSRTGRDRLAGPLHARLGTCRRLLPRQPRGVRLRGAQ